VEKQKYQSDYNTYRPRFDFNQCLRKTLANTGKSHFSQIREIFSLMRRPSLLLPPDYYYFQLYDDSKYSMEDKRRFLSDRAHAGVIRKCCDRSWWALADDKHFCYTLLQAFGAPTPRLQCIFSSGTRHYGTARTCRSAEELATFFHHEASFPIFAKPNGGIGSFGVFLVEGYDSNAKEVRLFGGSHLPLDSFCHQIDGCDGYLLQDVLKPHPQLIPICGKRISTVRVIVLLDQSSPEIIQSIWKIPGSDSIADNFWRKGNMLGAVDIETGEVKRVIRGYGFDLHEIQTHPDTGNAIQGITLPCWSELKTLCVEYARMFEKIRYLSWDIALCPEGPVVVEVNTGSSFMLSQLVTGEGFLTDRFCAFLEHCGYAIKRRPLPAT
jgi:hypothetical protein